MQITKKDPFTGQLNTLEIPVTEDELYRWQSGELIQNVMPHLTPDEREFLMTGIMPGSWESAFA